MAKPVLSPAFKRELAAANPIGMRLTPQDVDAWIDMVWLKMTAYHKKITKRVVVNWWSRLKEYELDEARARASRIHAETERARMNELAERIPCRENRQPCEAPAMRVLQGGRR